MANLGNQKLMECSSMRQFIYLVKSHSCVNGANIGNWDRLLNPSIFKIGFRCRSCGQNWFLGLSSFQNETKNYPDHGMEIIKEYNELAKEKGAQNLCQGFVDSWISKYR